MKFAKGRRFPASASASASSASRSDFAISTRHPPRQDDAMPDDSRNLGDEPRHRETEKPPIAGTEILYAARLQQAVTEVTATTDLASALAALQGLAIPLIHILANLGILAETVPIVLVICSLDTSSKALEAPLGVARLHIPPIHTSRPLTNPGFLTPTSLADNHHDHDHHHRLSD
ncbi:serine/threonine protein kinase-47 [Diaporthe amygdali]|uniref:serine/threonine protein kinase-47 n=1 Tax=Phomopsis amygdali TaxID=1214568 RepID=UPI0022FE960B|nr:serine/threonine protein kinase-47 [Diaporthe amygdali]KAJ0117692.1 serine/threonine protein kinase-47 [Diaporthe amygdali]